MSFVSYLSLIYLINDETFKIAGACEKFWQLAGRRDEGSQRPVRRDD